MKKSSLPLETYSHNFYAQGAEPALDNIAVQRYTVAAPAPAAARDDICLLYVVEGEGLLRVNGQGQRLAPGRMAKLFPYHRFSLEPEGEITFWLCAFPLSVLMYLDVKKRFADTDYTVVESGNPLVTLDEKDGERALGAFEEMAVEKNTADFFQVHMLLGNLFRLLALFDRQCELGLAQNGPYDSSLAWKALQRIHMYFNMENMDAASVAEALGIDPLRLGYLLRRLTGKGFTENLHEVRIRNACAMMLFEELPIAFIARYVGYSSQSTFFRVFKELKGVTPEAYRGGVVTEASLGAHRDTAWKVLAYLLEHYGEALTPAFVGEALFIGPGTVEKICRLNFGHSFTSLLEQIRLTYACSLLGAETIPVSDVALAVGFNSPRTFLRCFKKHLGVTPDRYRRSIKKTPLLEDVERP